MGEKFEKTYKRQELADFLITLGRQLRAGVIDLEGRQWPVPAEVEAKIHLKEKDSRLEAKIEWRWPTPAESGQPFRDTATRAQTPFKEVKTRLGAAFRELQRTAGQGSFPEARALEDFVAVCQAFAVVARPEWQEAMRQFLDHVKNLQLAVETRQLDAMHHALQDLANGMAVCHREFK